MERKGYALFLLLGWTSFSAQLLYLREFLNVFNGNEFNIGIFFLWWFFWGALGSLLYAFFQRRIQSTLTLFCGIYGLWQIALVMAFIVFRFPQVLLKDYVIKEIVSFSRVHFFTASVLAVPCVMNGFLFPLGIGVMKKQRSPVAAAYSWESLGAFLGGIILSLFLIARFLPGIVLLSIAIGNLFLIAIFLWRVEINRRLALAAKIAVVCLCLFLSRQILVQEHLPSGDTHILAVTDSAYERIKVIEQDGQKTLYLNNALFSSVPDALSAEEAVHLCLLQVPSPEYILIAGSVTTEMIAELEKYPTVKRIDCVLQDPAVIALLKDYFFRGEQRGKIHFFASDIQTFLRKNTVKYDALLMNYPLPLNVQFNYFYTGEFFSLAAQVLSEKGVYGFSTEGSEVYLSPPLRKLITLFAATLGTAFKNVAVIPGERIHFLASSRPLFSDYASYKNALANAGIATVFINEYYLKDRLNPARIAFLKKELEQAGRSAIAADNFHPLGYWYAFLYEGLRAKDKVYAFIQKLDTRAMHLFLLVSVIICGIVSAVLPRRNGSVFYLFSVLNGFVNISVTFLLLIVYQIFYGSLYYKIGILVAAYMLGLAVGSRGAGRFLKGSFFIKGIAVQCAFLSVLLSLLILNRGDMGVVVPEWVFFTASFVSGAIGGGLFVLINQRLVSLAVKPSPDAVFSPVYAGDLAGACIGAFLVPSFILPLAGVSCSMMFLVSLVGVYGFIFVIKHR